MALLAHDTSAIAASPIIRIWRHRTYALFMSGIGPYYVTGWMQRIGVGWLAWELTHDLRWLGAVAAADLAPMLVLAPIAGAVVDRTDPMLQMKISMAFVLVHAALLAGLALAGLMTIELLMVLTIVYGSLMPFQNAARTTIVPRSIPREDFPSAVSVDSSLFHGSRFVGPMLAAFVLRDFGIGCVFIAHVLGVAFFITQLYRMELPAEPRPSRTSSIVQDIGAGIAYVRRHPGILPLFVLMTTASVAARPLQDFLPAFSDKIYGSGAQGFAWLSAGMGVGAMMGAVWLALRGHTRGLTYIVILSAIAQGIAMLGFVATTHLLQAAAFAGMSGFALTVMSTGMSALVQLAVNDGMRGRVMSLFAMIYRGVPAIGAVAIGFAAQTVGLRTAFAMSAFGCVLIWLWMAEKHHPIDGAMTERG